MLLSFINLSFNDLIHLLRICFAFDIKIHIIIQEYLNSYLKYMPLGSIVRGVFKPGPSGQ